jgi:hypothetical protein
MSSKILKHTLKKILIYILKFLLIFTTFESIRAYIPLLHYILSKFIQFIGILVNKSESNKDIRHSRNSYRYNTRSKAVNFRFPFPKVKIFHLFDLISIRLIFLITKNDNLYENFPEVENFMLPGK